MKGNTAILLRVLSSNIALFIAYIDNAAVSEVCHPRCAFDPYPANVENMVSP